MLGKDLLNELLNEVDGRGSYGRNLRQTTQRARRWSLFLVYRVSDKQEDEGDPSWNNVLQDHILEEIQKIENAFKRREDIESFCLMTELGKR